MDWRRLIGLRGKTTGTQPPAWLRQGGAIASWPYPEREAVPPGASLVLTAAVRRIADLYREADLTAVRGDRPLPDHPALELLAAPNPYYDGSQLDELIVWGLITDGNAYLLWDEAARRLWWLDPRKVEPKSDDPNVPLTRYEYRPGGEAVSIAPERMIHLRRGCDPGNPAKGSSPVRNLGSDLQLEKACAEFGAAVVGNMGVPSVAISPKQGEAVLPTPEQNRELKLRWQSETAGRNKGNVVVLPFPVDIERLMLSPDDLSVGGLMGQTVSRICAAIGVDPMCLGLPSESKTYSNYEQALEALVRQVVTPLQETVARQLTDQLVRRILRDDRTELVWDRSGVYVLQDDEAAKRDSAARLYQSGVATLNEARALIGLPPVRGGDVPAGGRLAGLGGGL